MGPRVGTRAQIAGLMLIAILLAAYVLLRVTQAAVGLDQVSVVVNKVITVAQLHDHVLRQSYAIRGYMLYRHPAYREEFRHYARLSQQEMEQLRQVVRPARKALVEEILVRQQKYVALCEKEIIPLVEQGNIEDAARAARQSGAVILIEEMLDQVDKLQEMRLMDLNESLHEAIFSIRQALWWGFGGGLLILFTAAIFGFLVNRRLILENLVYRLILLNTRNAIIVVHRDGRIYLINRAAEEIFGLNGRAVAGMPFEAVFTGRQRPGEVAFSYPVAAALTAGEDICNVEQSYITTNGWHYALLTDCLQLRDKRGRVHGVVLITRDITERKVVEEKLRGLAVRDSLTMLYNHSYFKQVLDREVARASEQGGKLAYLMMDVDNFKSYNDQFGHPAGDELLRQLARLLEKNVRQVDIVGRYGGDEFAVILPGADQAVAVEVGERLRRAIADYPFPYRELMPGGRITVSVGVSCFPGDASSAAELIRQADEAMYNAKRNAKNRVEVWFSAFKELELDWPGERDVLYSIGGLLAMVNNKDRYTYGHSEKVAHYATALARATGLAPEEVKKIKVAAFLHDLGKVDIPEEILNKPGPLSEAEKELCQCHPVIGAEIVQQIKSLEEMVPLIRHHHERYDGKGYPDGLAGEAIPLGARIIAIADSFDAMTTNRPYRRAKTHREALEEIRKEAGRQFDPHLAELFVTRCAGSGASDAGEVEHALNEGPPTSAGKQF
ncbi:diguanylate cyclase and metal dependent phosphohydrolase [Desulfofundulus kuznetsovii DSM 6115]|uniref:Diguanylate cyclase and metal dependent phosphohydrolase n=1 Tax=Desulfofundulus kuznetsovii (strain DSM 6115 / VKM B-1805 / 17) TaxID=760568 RepID=A0AAU8Q2A0_DESK7|nr:diguanylate cyclase and metal dependent phosphohydrolase [Desulfofundulus kuznetsovii DSM 6115]